jgi:hypothetical protein
MNTLAHSPADVVRWLMIDLSLGTDPAGTGTSDSWPIHASSEPDYPDNLITIYDTAGVQQGRIQNTGETVEHRGIMVQVRGTDHATAWGKMDAIKVALDESVHNSLVIVDSSQYTVYAVTKQSGPLSLGREQNTNRFLFTLNAIVALQQLS